jgi:microcystin-dependent protein
MTAIDAVVGGRVSKALSSSNITLSQTEANNKLLTLTGTLSANVTVSYPAIGGNFIVFNNTTGAFSVTVKTTAGGSTGVEVSQGIRTSIVLDGTNSYYADESSVPPGTALPFTGVRVPAGFLFMYGQNASRTTYPGLFTAITLTITGNTVSGSPTLNTLSINPTLYPIIGAAIEGTGIPIGTTILSATSTTIVMSANATSNNTGITIRIAPYGLGDGSTTFGIPDWRGRIPAGLDNMGGSAAGRLSGYTNIGVGLGEQNHTLLTAQLPSHTHSITDPGHIHNVTDPGHTHTIPNNYISQTGGSSLVAGGAFGVSGNPTNSSTTGISIQSNSTGITATNSTGSGTAFNVVQPTIMSNWMIKY